MALNPLLDNLGIPLLYPSEVIVCTHKNTFASIEFMTSAAIPRNPGTIYLTNARIIFIHKNVIFKENNFALHFNLITDEVPVLENSYFKLEGKIVPYSNFMPSQGKFRIEILGECDLFRNQVNNFIKQIRMVSHSPITQNRTPANQAFVDPSDPDIILLFDKTATVERPSQNPEPNSSSVNQA